MDNAPLNHFDSERRPLPITREEIAAWCLAEFGRLVGWNTDMYIQGGRFHMAQGMSADAAVGHVQDQVQCGLTAAGDRIWDLAREFSFDPIRHDHPQMQEMLQLHVEREIAVNTGEPDSMKSIEICWEAIRDTVRMLAITGMAKRVIAEEGDTRASLDLMWEEMGEVLERIGTYGATVGERSR